MTAIICATSWLPRIFEISNFDFLMTASIFLFQCVYPWYIKSCHLYYAKIKFDDSSGDLQQIEDLLFL